MEFAGLVAPLSSTAAAVVSPRWASLDTPRPAVSRWAATPGGQPAAEGWPVEISALLLCAATLGLSATVARTSAGAPRMDMELGEMDAASPSRALGSHGVYLFPIYKRSKRHRGTAFKLSNA